MARDPYLVLGISKTSSVREIEDAYRRLSEIYDVERYGGTGSGARDEAQRKLNELRAARAILIARHKRLFRPRAVPTLARRDLIFILVICAIGLVVALTLMSVLR